MEQDPFEARHHSPENSWSYFEQDPDNEDKRETKKKWFFEKDDDEKPEQNEKPKADTTEDNAKPEKPEAKKAQLTPEDLADMSPEQQKQALAKQYVANRSEELQEELAAEVPGSTEALEIAADIELIQTLAEKLDDPELEVNEAVEEAYRQIMERLDEILGINQETENTVDELEIVADEPPDYTTEAIIRSPLFPRRSSATPPAQKKPTTTQDTPGETSRPTHTPSPNPSPITRVEVIPKAPDPESPKAIRQRRAGNLAVAEALNQMLSRRYEATTLPNGAEATPIPSNPERVINPIKRTIAEKEQRVRRLATAQVVRPPELTTPETPANAPTKIPYLEGKPVSLNPVTLEQTHFKESKLSPPHERVVSAETSRNLQQASTNELLQIADKIKINGTSLRELFTSNQIDRAGLTKVISEALKGGDVQSALKKARLGEEAQRGRKIEMRHDDPAVISDVHSPTAKAAEARTQQILEALQSVNAVTEQESNSPFTPETEQERALAEAAEKIAKTNRLIIASVAATAAVVIAGTLLVIFHIF